VIVILHTEVVVVLTVHISLVLAPQSFLGVQLVMDTEIQCLTRHNLLLATDPALLSL
jgi:hypothetical protein